MTQLFEPEPLETDDADPILDAALRYAAQGLAVFPVRLGVRGDGKKDVSPIAAWRSASTADPATIIGWFTGPWQGCALAADTGKSGVVVIDQDVSDGKRGPQEWDAIGQKSELRVNTPSGGRHDWFRADDAHPVTVDNSGAVADGVDVRGQGGFVFLPPSADPRGGAWTWESEPEDLTELPAVPPVVIERMAARQAGRREAPLIKNGQDDGQLFERGGGPKTRRAAFTMLGQELHELAGLIEQGSSRSHLVATRIAPMAGHGIDVFWSYDYAHDAIMAVCRANGFVAAHGERYVSQQISRGLDFGSEQPWTEVPETAPGQSPAPGQRGKSLKDQLVTLADLRAMPAPEHLIKGILTKHSGTWLIAAPGGFKSFLALDWAAHIATGRPWMGRKTRQEDVLYVVGEGVHGIGKRLTAWAFAHGQSTHRLRVLPVAVQARGYGGAGLSEQWGELVELVREMRPGLIVLDTQARMTVGLNENDARDTGIFLDGVERLKQASGACVLVVHHTGRNGNDARGSSAIDGAQDAEWKLTRPDKGLRATLTCEKSKDTDDTARIDLVLRVVPVGVDEDGQQVTSLVVGDSNAFVQVQVRDAVSPGERGAAILLAEGETDEARRLVLMMLAEHDPRGNGLSRAEIQALGNEALKAGNGNRTKYDRSVYTRALNRLCEDGKVTSDDRPTPRYRMSDLT